MVRDARTPRIHYDGLQLRAMRLLIGCSPEKLTAFIAVSSKTIRNYEENGTFNRAYAEALLDLAENRNKLCFAPDLPSGRPAKRWHRLPGRRHYDVGSHRTTAGGLAHARYWLWMPGNPDHLHAIKEPPTGFGDMWLEYLPDDAEGARELRRRYVLREFGHQWVDDINPLITKT